MTSSPQGTERDFRAAAVVFVSFLYAAAVHLLVHHAFKGEDLPVKTAFLVVLLIVFIFSDWCSRTRLPNLTGDTPSPLKFIVKTLLEIVGVFFLAVSFLELLHPLRGVQDPTVARFTPVAAFGAFLVITAFWDYLMLLVIEGLDWTHLATASIRGTADSLKEIEPYLASYSAFVKRRESEIVAQRTKDAANLEKQPTDAHFDVSFRLLGGSLSIRLFRGIRGCVMQTLANHVAYANIVAGSLILYTELWRGGVPLIHSVPLRGLPWPHGNMLFVLIITCVALLVVLGRRVGGATAAAVFATWVVLLIFSFKAFAAFCYVAAPILFLCLLLVIIFGISRRRPRRAADVVANPLLSKPAGVALDETSPDTAKLAATSISTDAAATVSPVTPCDTPPAHGDGDYSFSIQCFRIVGALALLGCMLGAYAAFAPTTVMIIMAVQQTLANVFLQATVVPPASNRAADSPTSGLQTSPA